jgi:hypothetical protein
MLRRPYYLTALVLGACLVQNAMAWPDTAFTGGAGDGLWSSVGNWSGGMVPGIAPGDTNGSIQLPGGYTVTIQAGETFTCDNVANYATIFGPEWGSTLNIYGNLSWYWYLAPVGAAGNPSTINLYGNAAVSGEGIGLGYNWWYNGGPYVNMNVYDSSTVNINYFFWGGHLNLYGGTFTTGGVADGTVDAVSDATRLMNLAGGQLVLPGDATSTVNGWVSRGIIQGYGVVGSVAIDTTTNPGYTLVTGVVPEPTSMALLGLGAGVMMLVFRRRA